MAKRDRDRDDKDDDRDERPARGGRGRDRDEERDEPRGGRGRGRDSDRGGGKGLDLDSDFIAAGLFGPGPATITESIFADYTYGGTQRKPVPVWLITYQRGEGKTKETYEQPYSVGTGWDVSKDGMELIPMAGQTGLPDSCNAAKYLIGPLRELGFKGKLGNNPRGLEGLEVELDRVAQEKRDFKEDRGGGRGDRDRGGRDRDDRGGRGDRDRDRDNGRADKTILKVIEILDGGKSSKRSSRDKDDEVEEKPKRRSRDDDEEEKPKRRGGRDREEEPEADDEKLTEDAVETVIEILEKEEDPVAIDDLEGLLKKKLKDHDDAKAILKIATSDEFLAEEKGWLLNTKKGTIRLP